VDNHSGYIYSASARKEEDMKEPRREQWLTREGASWHYEPDVPLNKVDREASLKNQARFKALDQDHVYELGLRAEKDELNALIGYYNKEGRIVIIDGNHRMEAYLLVGITKADFYIVDTPHPWVIDILTRTANIGDEPLPREQRLSHAIYMVKNDHISARAAAEKLGLHQSTVNQALEAEEVRERLARMGFTEEIALTSLPAIHRIKQNNALLETAKLISEAGLNIDEVRDVARRVQRASVSEKGQMNELAKIRQYYQTRIETIVRKGKTKPVVAPIIQYRKDINSLNKTRPESIKPFLDSDLIKRSKNVLKKIEEVIT